MGLFRGEKKSVFKNLKLIRNSDTLHICLKKLYSIIIHCYYCCCYWVARYIKPLHFHPILWKINLLSPMYLFLNAVIHPSPWMPFIHSCGRRISFSSAVMEAQAAPAFPGFGMCGCLPWRQEKLELLIEPFLLSKLNFWPPQKLRTRLSQGLSPKPCVFNGQPFSRAFCLHFLFLSTVCFRLLYQFKN